MLKNIRRLINGIVFLPFWYLEKMHKRNSHIWVFGSWFGIKYSDNSRALYEYVLEHCPEIHPYWVTYSDSVYKRLLSENKPVVKGNSKIGHKICLNAGLAFITTSPTEVGGQYLNGAKFIWLWHGVGLKHIMADYRRDMWPTYSPYKKLKVKINTFLYPYENKIPVDALANTSDFFTPFFCSGFEINKERVWVDGYPRNDKLFCDKHEELYQNYRAKFPNAKFIFYMPTHRINAQGDKPFCGFEGYGFNANIFYSVLEKGNYIFFNKSHFYDSKISISLTHERFINVTDTMYDDLYVLLKDMDILITDFSSVYFDFLLTGKPIILAPFDFDIYLKRERSLQFDYNMQKALQVRSWPELLDALINNRYYCPKEEEIKLFHKNLDNSSCDRIYNRCKNLMHIPSVQ